MNGNALSAAAPTYGGSSTSLFKQNGGTSGGKIYPTVPAKMPKHIQMGTGYPMSTPPMMLASSATQLSSSSQQTNLNQIVSDVNSSGTTASQPDLLSDHTKHGQHNTR